MKNRSRHPRWNWVGPVLAFLLAGWLGACLPTQPPVGASRDPSGVPVGKSPFVRAGTFSYEYSEMRPTKDGGLILDFAVINGTHRSYSMVTANVGLYGKGGRGVSQRVQIGPIRKGDNRRAVARFGQLDFEVVDVVIEIVHATP